MKRSITTEKRADTAQTHGPTLLCLDILNIPHCLQIMADMFVLVCSVRIITQNLLYSGAMTTALADRAMVKILARVLYR